MFGGLNMNTSAKLRKIQRMRKIKKQRQKALLLVMLVVAIVVTFVFNGNTNANEKYNVTSVTVKSGDTLWSIAKEYKPDGKDIRQFICELSEFNQIDNASILVGQTIFIPLP